MESRQEICDNDLIKDVMASMGWSNMFVPIASEENKKLLDAIKFIGQTKLDRIDALEAHNKEAHQVSELLNNVDNEFDQNLKLLTAHKSQFSTEHHLFKLAEHDESMFKQTLKDVTKELKDLEEQKETLKSKPRLTFK